MGLKDWINRYVVEIRPAAEPAPPPRVDDPPEVRARAIRLVPTERRAGELLGAGPGPGPVFDAPRAFADLVDPAPPSPAAAPEPEPAPPAADPLDDGGPPPVDVAQVYAAAKLATAPHGFTAEKLETMLTDPRLAALDEPSRAQAIAVVLEGSGVRLEQIVKDAAQRDQALDRFEDFLTDKLISLQVETDRKLEELRETTEREVARLQGEIDQLRQRQEAERARGEAQLLEKRRELARYRRVKRGEERRLFEVVRHFTAENPISVSAPAAGAAPPPPPASPVDDPPPGEPPADPGDAAGDDDTGVFRVAPDGVDREA